MTSEEAAPLAQFSPGEAYEAWVDASEAVSDVAVRSSSPDTPTDDKVDRLCEYRMTCLRTLSITPPHTLTDCRNQLAAAISTEVEIAHGSPMDLHWALIRQVTTYLQQVTNP